MMLSWLASFLSGPIINGVISGYKAKLEAGNNTERIAADLAARELAVQQREVEVNAQVVIAEQNNWFTACVRPLWAAPFVIWTWKAVVYDKVLGWGSTDELHGMIATLCVTVAAAYFGGRSLEKIAHILKR